MNGENDGFQGNSSSAMQISVSESAQAMEAAQAAPQSRRWYKNVYNKLSPSRQIFCLFCVFDFLFTFFLWIIYAQGVAVTGLDDSLSAEIKHYGIASSLFDIVILSLSRVTILLVVYAYYNSKRILAVALTTFVSTGYLISKAIVFDFDDSSKDNGSRPVDYFLHIGSFVLVWVEAWYMQVKVLPKERREAPRNAETSPKYGSTKSHVNSGYSKLGFHTPPEQDSEDEEEVIRANLAYIETARKATSKALTFLYAEKSWNIEKQKDDMLIESTTDEKMGKIVRMRTCINANQQIVHKMVFGDPENVKKWNKSVTHAEVIQKINSTTDISYSRVAELAGGLVSARDYVTINHYQRIGEMYMSSSTSIVTPDKPPVAGVIRGESTLSAYALLPAENEPDKSEFVWIVTTKLKPSSIPQVFVDQGIPGFLFECVTNLKKECEHLKNDANTPL